MGTGLSSARAGISTAPAGSPAHSGAPNWKADTLATTPAGRLGASMVYDAADGYLLLFGGCGNAVCSGTTRGDTWAFSHNKWTDLTPNLTKSPPSRAFAAMAYDPVDQEVVMYGGLASTNFLLVIVRADTWVFSHGKWADLTANLTTAPAGRYRASMTFDGADGYVLLFGGTSNYGVGATYNKTWSFVHQNWTDLSPNVTGSPPARYRAAMAYDPADHYVVLFGGCTLYACPNGETWTYVGGAWTNLTGSLAQAPSGRIYPALSYDGKALLLFGGGAGVVGPTYNDTWKFLAGVWTLLHPLTSPVGRYGASMALEPHTGVVWLFGGLETSGGHLFQLHGMWKYH